MRDRRRAIRFLFTFIGLLFFTVAFSQDTIQLKELVLASKVPNFKEEVFKFGKGQRVNKLHALVYSAGRRTPYMLLDNLQGNFLKEVTLYFSWITEVFNPGKISMKGFKVIETQYEVSFYEALGDKLGNPINSAPLLITLGPSDDDRVRKMTLPLKGIRFSGGKIFVALKCVTNTSCAGCNYYAPHLYVADQPKIFYADEKGILAHNVPPNLVGNPSAPQNNLALRADVTTLVPK